LDDRVRVCIAFLERFRGKAVNLFFARDREGGQIMINAPLRAGWRSTKNPDQRAIPVNRPMV